MVKGRIQIAIVDDDPSFLRALDRLLRTARFAPLTYASGETFLLEYPFMPLDCVILDIDLGTMTGFDVARKLAAEKSRVPIIFMTGRDDPAAREQAEETGCVAYLRKPCSPESLFDAIRLALQ